MQIDISKKYQTRDGRAVRLLCVDGPSGYPIFGIVGNGYEKWTAAGKYTLAQSSNQTDPSDLIESPREIQVRGWIRVQKDGSWGGHHSRQGATSPDPSYPPFAVFEINETVKEGSGL